MDETTTYVKSKHTEQPSNNKDYGDDVQKTSHDISFNDEIQVSLLLI